MVEPYQPLYTVKEASKVLKTNTDTIYDLLSSGKLPYLVLGCKKIKGTDLERFIESLPAENKERRDQPHVAKLYRTTHPPGSSAAD